MQELQQQINNALRKLEEKSNKLISIRSEKIKYGMKATIFIGELPLIDGYVYEMSSTQFHEPQLKAIINAFNNYDLTLID